MPRKTKGTDSTLEEIRDLLDVLVNLNALILASGKGVTDGARSLKMAGLDNQTIADILNTTPATIRAVTSNLRTKLSSKRR